MNALGLVLPLCLAGTAAEPVRPLVLSQVMWVDGSRGISMLMREKVRSWREGRSGSSRIHQLPDRLVLVCGSPEKPGVSLIGEVPPPSGGAAVTVDALMDALPNDPCATRQSTGADLTLPNATVVHHFVIDDHPFRRPSETLKTVLSQRHAHESALVVTLQIPTSLVTRDDGLESLGASQRADAAMPERDPTPSPHDADLRETALRLLDTVVPCGPKAETRPRQFRALMLAALDGDREETRMGFLSALTRDDGWAFATYFDLIELARLNDFSRTQVMRTFASISTLPPFAHLDDATWTKELRARSAERTALMRKLHEHVSQWHRWKHRSEDVPVLERNNMRRVH